MGAGVSQETYSQEVYDMAEKRHIGIETAEAIYVRFKKVAGHDNKISNEKFRTLFPFVTNVPFENLVKHLHCEDGVQYTHFVDLFLCLAPGINNESLLNLIFDVFVTPKGFSCAHFIAELRCNMIFTDTRQPEALRNYLEPGAEQYKNGRYLPKKLFVERAKKNDLPIITLGKQLIFCSSVFQ